MIILIIFTFISFALIGFLLYENHKEQYLSLKNLGNDSEKSLFYNAEKKSYPRGGLKYNRDTDYSHFKQRRAIGQNRTDGKDS